MTEAEATLSTRRRISAVWLIPIAALVLGIWMVVHTVRSQGPEIDIVFSDGAGIEAEKTKIKFRAVEIGHVESVGLAEDLESVVVTARIAKEAASLLRETTQFWVVRPRIGPGGISGLGTLLSGGYIQLSVGTGPEGRHHFEGLDAPPITPGGAPGLAFKLVSEQAGSVSAGDPILYKHFRVGRVDSATFDVDTQQMHYGAFIEAPYDELVSSTSRFWNASGIAVSATADGFHLETGSLESLLVGGIAFGLPDGMEPGEPVEGDATFTLYANHASVNEKPYHQSVEYVVRFDRSVRGLRPGAPVEYRGIRIGRVERLLLSELADMGLDRRGQPIPVLIRLEPGRLELPDTEEGAATLVDGIEQAVESGLRGTLSTGNLLTGSLYVSFDLYPDAPDAAVERFADLPTIPTIAGGLERIEVRVTALLEKLNNLPLEQLLDNMSQLLANLDTLVASDEVAALPGSIDETLATLRTTLASVSTDSTMQEGLLRTITELDRTLRSLRSLLETLDEQPNALIFNRKHVDDPQPRQGAK